MTGHLEESVYLHFFNIYLAHYLERGTGDSVVKRTVGSFLHGLSRKERQILKQPL